MQYVGNWPGNIVFTVRLSDFTLLIGSASTEAQSGSIVTLNMDWIRGESPHYRLLHEYGTLLETLHWYYDVLVL